jgi:hypothetical protein
MSSQVTAAGIESHRRFEAIRKMSRRVLRPKAEVCQLCDFITARSPLSIPSRSRKALQSRSSFATATSRHAQRSPFSNSPAIPTYPTALSRRSGQKIQRISTVVSQSDLKTRLEEIDSICNKLLSPDRVVTEEETHARP